MDREFILRKLSNLMQWDDARDDAEFSWLRLMARLKFDHYQDFPPGARFIESLVDWLQQFKPEVRETAYDFMRRRLVYIGQPEMNHLVESFFPEVVQPRLVAAAAAEVGVRPFRVWVEPKAIETYDLRLRKTLFIELSDGARIDIFRRANSQTIKNEQIVTAPRIHPEKWGELLRDLRDDTGIADARFSTVYLVDDFTASGTSLIQYNEEAAKWKGKLPRFWEEVKGHVETTFEAGWQVYVHHFIATARAKRDVKQREKTIRGERQDGDWFPLLDFTFGTVLNERLVVGEGNPHGFLDLVDQYYDKSIEAKKHNLEGGCEDIKHGYSGCALPLILDHNTPNNSLALLWAESEGKDNRHAMRPLFRRRQRHS